MKDYKARRIAPYVIDGGAAAYSEWAELSECVHGGKPVRKTQFAAAHDGKYLYFAFRAEDDNICPVRTQYNSKIYEEEVVEVFISGKDISKYIELEISPNNTRFCGLVRNNLKGSRNLRLLKRCIFDSKTWICPDGWTAEFKIAIKDAADKLNIRDLKDCRFNAYRIDRPEGKPWELSALSPTGRAAFHRPESFIKLIMED